MFVELARWRTTGRSAGARRELIESHFEYAVITTGAFKGSFSETLKLKKYNFGEKLVLEIYSLFGNDFQGNKLGLEAAYVLVRCQLELKFTSVVHVEIIMSRIIGMQNDFLTSLSPCIKQHVYTKRKIIKKYITPFRLNSPMSTR